LSRALRIAVAEDEPLMRDYLAETLALLGHEVTCLAQTGTELIEHCKKRRPDLLLTDIRLPDIDGLDAAAVIYADQPLPVIVVSAFFDPELIARAEKNHVLAYLVKPIKRHDLEPALAIAMRRFEEFMAVRNETTELLQALEDRKVIEHAKTILMKRTRLDEPAAFRRLQMIARSKNRKLIEIARGIVTVEDAYAGE
jgi:AmiR/NasT family two-component response regulator